VQTGYYNRFNPDDEFEKHLFIAGKALQSAELNEVQDSLSFRLKSVGDAIFKNGDVIRDARISVNVTTGDTFCESGAIYLNGAVRGVPTGSLTVPVVGSVTLGVYITSTEINSAADSTLLDPASISRNYQEAGAARLKMATAWGYDGDGQTGDFYPVYTILDGVQLSKSAPPTYDLFSQALASYDRDSAGGTYIVDGMGVSRLADLPDGRQVYSVAEGKARVNGYGIDQPTGKRLIFDAQPNLRLITTEPHLSTNAGAQRVDLSHTPINNITAVQITAAGFASLTHGGFIGALDLLPDTSVLQITAVTQGATTYTVGVDFQLTADQVDWSLGGAEPATGSTYDVAYEHITTVVPTSVDDTGMTVTGAVIGTLVLVSYNFKLSRIDRLAATATGEYLWVKGVASIANPQAPLIPGDVLSLATIYQAWDATTTVTNDGVRVVPMTDLNKINGRIDYMVALIAQQRLEGSANLRDASQKKGLFTDPFIDDTLRDAGEVQTAAIVDGALMLPITVTSVSTPSLDPVTPKANAFTLIESVSQTSRTGSMNVNPYMAFDVLPARVELSPAVDRWTVNVTSWTSAVIRGWWGWSYWGWRGRNWRRTRWNRWGWNNTTTEQAGQSETLIPYIRQRNVSFVIDGFGGGEVLASVTFDGITVTAV